MSQSWLWNGDGVGFERESVVKQDMLLAEQKWRVERRRGSAEKRGGVGGLYISTRCGLGTVVSSKEDSIARVET